MLQLTLKYVVLFVVYLWGSKIVKVSTEGLSLLEMLDESRRRFSSRPAVHDDVCCLTHDQLHERADHFAAVLVEHELYPKSIVGIYMEGSADYVAVMLGVLKAGHVFMPLNTEFPPAKLGSILEKTSPALLVTDRVFSAELQQKLSGLGDEAQPRPDVLVYPPSDPDLNGLKGSGRPSTADTCTVEDMRDACYIFTTSGSTGSPKAILGSYRGLSHFIRWETSEFGFDESTRGSLLSPVTFDVSLRDIFTPLAVGGCVCIPAEKTIRDPAGLFRWMRNNRISLTHIVPTLFRLLTRALLEQQECDPLPDLTYILLAGEASYGSDVEKWRQAAGLTAQIVNLYGPSETTLAKMFCRIADGSVATGEILPIGRPIPDTRVLILADGRECGVGEAGEIYLGTEFRSKGYYRDPELNFRHFVVNPLSSDPNDILYKTGDQGEFLADGGVKFLGRLDGQVKLHGKRTDLGEIETVLRQYAGIHQAAVAVKQGDSDSQRLVGYIVHDGDDDLSVEEMRAFLREKLPEYMVPQFFVYLDALPLTHSGKVDRNALPDPGRRRPHLSTPYVPPQNDEEKTLCSIWGDVLEIDEIGTRDGFFELGGSSVLGMHVVERIRSAFTINIPVVKLFEFPNVALLAGYLRDSTEDGGAFAGLDDRARRRRAAMMARKK